MSTGKLYIYMYVGVGQLINGQFTTGLEIPDNSAMVDYWNVLCVVFL